MQVPPSPYYKDFYSNAKRTMLLTRTTCAGTVNEWLLEDMPPSITRLVATQRAPIIFVFRDHVLRSYDHANLMIIRDFSKKCEMKIVVYPRPLQPVLARYGDDQLEFEHVGCSHLNPIRSLPDPVDDLARPIPATVSSIRILPPILPPILPRGSVTIMTQDSLFRYLQEILPAQRGQLSRPPA